MTSSRIGLTTAAFFALVSGSPAAQVSVPKPDFCARLAQNSGIDQPASPDGRTEWTAHAMNFGQRFLIGGSVATGVGLRPVEPATLDDYRRLDTMCTVKGKGAVCQLIGPAIFKFTWKGREILTPMAAGERATVSVLGSKTNCRTEMAQ